MEESKFSSRQWLREMRDDVSRMVNKATGYTFFLQELGGFLTQLGGGEKLAMSREGNRDTLRVACVLKPSGAQSVTSLVLMRDQNARRELRRRKTGKPEDKQGIVDGTMTPAEKVAHERSGHATYVSRCEMCIEVGGTSRHRRRKVAEAAHIDNATVMRSQHVSENEDLGWCLCERRDILREKVIARDRNPMIWRSFSVILLHRGPCGTLNGSKTLCKERC